MTNQVMIVVLALILGVVSLTLGSVWMALKFAEDRLWDKDWLANQDKRSDNNGEA